MIRAMPIIIAEAVIAARPGWRIRLPCAICPSRAKAIARVGQTSTRSVEPAPTSSRMSARGMRRPPTL
jgi:hypothetical protein